MAVELYLQLAALMRLRQAQRCVCYNVLILVDGATRVAYHQ
jgi:hypothetical protein